MRIINADDAVKAILNVRENDLHAGYPRQFEQGAIRKALRCIETTPTIDAVPVVRCKDCIHWYDVEGVCLKIYSDGAVSSYAWQFREPNDFCSYGKHKEET